MNTMRLHICLSAHLLFFVIPAEAKDHANKNRETAVTEEASSVVLKHPSNKSEVIKELNVEGNSGFMLEVLDFYYRSRWHGQKVTAKELKVETQAEPGSKGIVKIAQRKGFDDQPLSFLSREDNERVLGPDDRRLVDTMSLIKQNTWKEKVFMSNESLFLRDQKLEPTDETVSAGQLLKIHGLQQKKNEQTGTIEDFAEVEVLR